MYCDTCRRTRRGKARRCVSCFREACATCFEVSHGRECTLDPLEHPLDAQEREAVLRHIRELVARKAALIEHIGPDHDPDDAIAIRAEDRVLRGLARDIELAMHRLPPERALAPSRSGDDDKRDSDA